MSGIGAELPPHLLARRKRKQDEESENGAATGSGAKNVTNQSESDKRRRVIGPVMPPASLDERPSGSPERKEDSDSDEDDFGPSLPSNGETKTNLQEINGSNRLEMMPSEPPKVEEKPQRDEWMTMPPTQDDLAARMDPTKQRPRAFNTGKGARGPNALENDGSAWHETPEQKQKRLADEMMGVSKPSGSGSKRPPSNVDAAKDDADARKIREHTEKTRGPSLLDQHQRSVGKDVDDDPSKRVFDREKDMGSGMRIGHAQRKEMLNKASNFSSKFSGGSYL